MTQQQRDETINRMSHVHKFAMMFNGMSVHEAINLLDAIKYEILVKSHFNLSTEQSQKEIKEREIFLQKV